MIGPAIAVWYTAQNLPSDTTLRTMRAQIRRATAARGWPADAQRAAAELADGADDGEELRALADWLAGQPYPAAERIASIATAAAGAGTYREGLASLTAAGVEGALDDAGAVAGGVRAVGGAVSSVAGAARRNPAIVLLALAAAAGLALAARR
jgi:hypothetical protein